MIVKIEKYINLVLFTYSMNYAHLEILGITVPIGHIDKYHDDGFVESITAHVIKLSRFYDFDCSNSIRLDERAVGKCTEIYPNCHIFYVKQSTETKNIFVRANEETHALDIFNQLDALAEKLLKEQRIKINFKEIDEDEVRATLGSLYALHARGIPQSEIESLCKMYGDGDSGTIAKRIYEQSKLPRK